MIPLHKFQTPGKLNEDDLQMTCHMAEKINLLVLFFLPKL